MEPNGGESDEMRLNWLQERQWNQTPIGSLALCAYHSLLPRNESQNRQRAGPRVTLLALKDFLI